MWQVTNERQDASPLLGFVPLFASMAEDIGKHLSDDLELEFLVEFSRRHVRMAAIVSQWEAAGQLTVARLASPDFAAWIENGLADETRNLNALGDRLREADFSTLTNAELASAVAEAISTLRDFIVYNNFVNTSDFYHGLLTGKILACLHASAPPAAVSPEETYSVLTTPEKAVWIQEEEEDFLRLLGKVEQDPGLVSALSQDLAGVAFEDLPASLQVALQEHAGKYFWIRYEQEGETQTAKHFHSALAAMVRGGIDARAGLEALHKRRASSLERFNDVQSRWSFTPETAQLLRAARMLVYWKLHLREVKVRFYCCAEPLLTEAAVRLSLDRHQVRHLTPEELIDALRGRMSLDPAALNGRIEYSVFHFKRNGTRVLEGQEAREAFSIVRDETVDAAANEVHGTCAFPGLALGPVRQVLRVDDADRFPRGCVLVAYMTDVGVVPAMKRASAIVTDVGGVTCHASIIAREFRIPCVIGTKVATKALRDGYQVEVNATDGVVRILSRDEVLRGDASDAEASGGEIALEYSLPTSYSPAAFAPRVRTLAQLTSEDVPIAGGKGAALGALTQMRLRVPAGFVILTSVFGEFIARASLAPQINQLLREIRDLRSLRVNSEMVQNAIISAEIPADIEREIHAAFSELGASYVAVRSSATVEDSVSASWAGQLESYLNTTAHDLTVNVRRCWASLFSERAMVYRQHCGAPAGSLETAVVVQRMVDSRVAGTAFSIHPVTRDAGSVFIECCVGLGETLVLGRETPSAYVVAKATGEIVERSPGSQKSGLRRARDGGGNEAFSISEAELSAALLSDDEVKEVAAMVAGIEQVQGCPVDVEWAFEGENLYILQSRPVTSVSDS